MRNKKDILNDFKICFLESASDGCKGCTYFKNGRCVDDENNDLSKEVAECLELDNAEFGDETIWQILNKICNMSNSDIQECFGIIGSYYNVIETLSVQDVIACLHEWESKSNKPIVGDIVDCYDSYGIVTRINKDDTAYILFDDGSSGSHKINDCKKVGKHIELTDLFALINDTYNEF